MGQTLSSEHALEKGDRRTLAAYTPSSPDVLRWVFLSLSAAIFACRLPHSLSFKKASLWEGLEGLPTVVLQPHGWQARPPFSHPP